MQLRCERWWASCQGKGVVIVVVECVSNGDTGAIGVRDGFGKNNTSFY